MDNLYIISAIIVSVPFLFIFLDSLPDIIKRRKSNKQFVATYGKKNKKRCLDCKYCKTFIYRPFHSYQYRNHMTRNLPEYCKKFYSNLPHDEMATCIALWLENAEFEGENNPIAELTINTPCRDKGEQVVIKLQKDANKKAKRNAPKIKIDDELLIKLGKAYEKELYNK